MQASFANDTLPNHLRREITTLFGSSRHLALLALVALFAGVTGPFGTYEALSPASRYLFWTLVVVGTAAAGQVTGTAVELLIRRLAWPAVPKVLVCAVLSAPPVFGVVVVALLGFGFRPDAQDLVILYLQCTAVVAGIGILAFLLAPQGGKRAETAPPMLMRRLPGARRGRLIRLAAQDHYVEVVTTGGRTLVPMRFRDAIAEAAPEPGAQVHRSHWVALRAVSGRGRVNHRPGLHLSDGSFVPIGRKFRSEAQREGLG
ncbi:MAG: LytTR family DNA-binding domain-containing protein [Pseudomonadota bacterium]